MLKKRFDTWSYASASSITIVGDYSNTYWPGMRIILKQTTLKYFLVTAVVYSSPNTTLTLDGFGVYTVANAPISAHIDTLEMWPKGFPNPGTLPVQGISIRGGGLDAAGSITSDADYGMILRAKTASPNVGEFTFEDQAGNPLFGFGGGSLISTGGLGVLDGLAEPSTVLGIGQLYVDSGTGELCVKFGDGAVKQLSPSGHLSMRPYIEIGAVAAKAKPTIVYRGASAGYSLPIWDAGTNADEQLFVSEYIAGRWDGASNIQLSIIGYLAGAEDVGDDFALQVSWMNKSTSSGVVPSSTTDVTVETNVDTDRAAQYSIYKVDFAIDWDYNDPDILASDYFAARIRRVAITPGTGKAEISGEFVVSMIIITYTVNKIFKV